MTKRIICFIAGLICAMSMKAHSDSFFTHYSSEDGLSQNTIMSILQDQKGNIWLATWDGINKFNGYSFKNYKARFDNRIALTHNRVDYMVEDKYGFLWLQTYDNLVYRFDTRTEKFERVPAEGEGGSAVNIAKIKVLPGGSVWLLSDAEGVVRVNTNPEDYSFTTQWFPVAQSGQNSATTVYQVYEDEAGNEWILSDNGLGMLSPGQTSPVFYFSETTDKEKKGGQAFYSCFEHDEEILFGSDKGRVWRYTKSSGQFTLLTLNASSNVVSINALDNGEMLFTTSRDGFFSYKGQNNADMEHFPASRFPEGAIYSVYVDRASEVWFEQHTPGSIVHFNPHTRVLKREQIAVEPTSTDRSRPAFHAHEDINGVLWVHPYGGGFSRFDRKSNSLQPFHNSLTGHDWRFSNKIHSAFSDSQGNLWMCTHSKGLEKITFQSSQFKVVIPVSHDYESLSNEVRALCEDADRNLWVGTKDGKLRMYDKERVDRGYLTEAGTVSKSGIPMRGNVYFVLQDSKQNLWIATKGDGLVKAEKIDSNRFKLTRYQHEDGDIYSLSDNNVYCVHEDSFGRIWVATFAGGVNYLTNINGKDVFVNHRNNLKGYPIEYCSKARFITGDNKGHIWIGTTVGALMIDESFKNAEDVKFHHYMRIHDDENSLSNNDVHCIAATQSNELYIGTFGGGLNKLTSLHKDGNATFKSYTMNDGVPSDVLLSIREDKNGNLWMSSENGISKFVPSKERFENYADKDVFFRVRFSEAASEYTESGKMLFGCSSGIFYFHPDSISKSTYVPPIVLSKLLVANKDVLPGEESVLKKGLDDTNELVLSHKENIFTIQFAALDYSAPSDIQYAYKLEGFEKEWNFVGRQRSATYTNLPKGHYEFMVRSTNADGVWTENTRTLHIEILPSFWETPFALFLYILLFLLIIITAVYVLFTIYRLKHEVSVEQQVTNIKLRFFTDISHELRTPLTLISGPVEYVLENTKLPDDAREQLLVVERNTNRMLRLINQILDFRKIQNHKMKMQVQRINVVAFTRKIMSNFDSVAEEHQIDFMFETEKEELYLWVDADKFEKIVFNLLSNAFKYTPNGKMITVSVCEDEKTVSVAVEDQGIGIAENKKKSLFVRFENLVDRNLFNQSSSTGIGLSLVKELVEMHKATISVDSKLGKGSCFKVDFQRGKEHYDETVELLKDDATAQLNITEQVTDVASEVPVPVQDEENLSAENLPEEAKGTMLLIEDNSELRLFLRSIFAAEYRVVEAVDGDQGLEKALKFLPDIIISDVMMPGKDGIALTRQLRSEMTTSHIPIVLLTAKTSIESKLEGLEYGADDYITKPFSATYLKVRVRNLLQQRQKLQVLYRNELMAGGNVADLNQKAEEEKEKAPEMSTNDRKFMDKLVELMEKNMDNGDLVVDDFVKELAVSRSVFFKKLKTLTGLAPVEFIKEMRIKRAVQYIETGDYSMTQIAYMVGINDPRYFSKCFKQKMGMTPTEFRDKVLPKR